MKKAIITIMIILLLAGGGFYGYKYVYQPQQEAKYTIEEKADVETKEIAEVGGTEDEALLLFDEMLKSDAQFFKFDWAIDRYETKVIQMPKAEYDAEFKGCQKRFVTVGKMMEHFFNLDASAVKGPVYENINGSNALFGKGVVSSTTQESLEEVFNKDDENIVTYFDKHNLKLSCKSVKPIKEGTKIAVGEDVEQHYEIYEAKVTTDDCTGDMSDIGLYANKGETKTIIVKVIYYDGWLDFIYFE